MSHLPPRWVDRILEWYCRSSKLEDLQGDLYEYHERNVEEHGKRLADLIYFIDVLKFFRIYTIKRIKLFGLMNFFYLLNNYGKTSVRSIARNKLFSAINVLGLAISMSVGVLMIIFISELLSYDTFHEKKDRIYKVINTYHDLEGSSTLYSTSAVAGYRLKDAHSAIEDVTVMRRNFTGDFQNGDKIISIQGNYADESFFSIFSFDLMAGDPATALLEPNSIVLTETTANKLFENGDAMGKTLSKSDDSEWIVTGVVKDPPSNSHMEFEALGSFVTYQKDNRKRAEESGNTPSVDAWGSMWMYHAYMLVDPDRLEEIDAFMKEISSEENKALDNWSIELSAMPMLGIVPGPDYGNSIGRTADMDIIWILLALTGIVILSACFNYTNLSIARSLRRAKEVGVRKTVGATQGQVFTQFIMEAVILSSIATVLALGLFYIIKPHFLDLAGNAELPVELNFQPVYILAILGFAVFVGLISGLLPSIFLSRIKALMALRDAAKIKLFGGVNLRLVLIVFQFTLSIAFIIGATITKRQYEYALNFDLGYETDNILNVRVRNNDPLLLKSEFEKISGVEQVTRSAMILSSGSTWGNYLKYEDPMDSVLVHLNYVDDGFVTMHGFEFLAGGDFTPLPENSELKHVIVNEKLIERFNIGTPDEAIGKTVELDDEGNQKIVGVVKDFQHRTIDAEHSPFLFQQITGESNSNHMNLKVNSADMVGLLERLDATWREIDKVHPFEAQFFDEKLQEAYMEFSVIFKIVSFLGFLAVSIAALGMLGIAVYTAESRMKEISIRKVLGATEQNLVMLLSRGFVLVISIASVLAIGVAYYLFEEVILADYVNRVTIGFWDLILGVVITMLIGLLTISWQTLSAARANPATTLRDD